MRTLEILERSLQRRLDQWKMVTRFHARRRLAKNVLAKPMGCIRGKVLTTPNCETSDLSESTSFDMRINEYVGNGNGAPEYHSLALDQFYGRTK